MLETMNRAPESTKQGQETRPVELDATSGGASAGRTIATDAQPFEEHRQTESALAYDLLLPNSATAIASIGIAGGPVLAPLRRDDATMVWCQLTDHETPAIAAGSSGGCAGMTSSGHTLPFPQASLDCAILHGTLDRWRDAPTLLNAVRIALKPGGMVAISVANGLEPAHLRRRLGLTRGGDDETPPGGKRSLWGYRRLLNGCGLSPTASYFVLQNPGAAPTRIISTAYAPSTAFFGHLASTLTGPRRLLMRGLNAVNLLPHAQNRFLILARK